MDVAVEPEAKRAKVDHVECGSQNSADSAPILLPEMGGVGKSLLEEIYFVSNNHFFNHYQSLNNEKLF